jgi:hypothetical protein
MTFKITGIALFLLLIFWQVIIYKQIKLKKWLDWTLSLIMGGVNSTDGISNFFCVIKITIIATTTPPIQEGISN